MATVNITNISTVPVLLSDLYITLAVGGSVSVTRRPAEIQNMTTLFTAEAAGQITYTITYTSAEQQAMQAQSSESALTDPLFYINPSTGSDGAVGSASLPLATLDEALRRLRSSGWKGKPRIWMAGILALGLNPKISLPANSAAGLHEPILIQSVSSTDSGQGTLAVSSSTAGSGTTFGTITVSSATWTTNQWRRFFLRFTSGTQSGKQYLIASNSGTVLTLAGTLTVPTNGDTFVIETPAGGFSWTGQLTVEGHGSTVGLKNLEFSSDSSGLIRFYDCLVLVHAVRFTNYGSSGIQLVDSARMEMISTLVTIFSDNTILQQVGIAAKPTTSPGPITISTGSVLNVQRSVFENAPVDSTNGATFVQVQTSYFTGFSYARAVGTTTFALVNVFFDTVTPGAAFTGSPQGAAVIAAKGTYGLFVTVRVDNTPSTTSPGDALLVMSSHADMQAVTGTGNAGVGLRLKDAGYAKNIGSNTVTGTGGDIQIGGHATATAWGAGALGNDLADTTPQICAVFA